jgi:MFS family permease
LQTFAVSRPTQLWHKRVFTTFWAGWTISVFGDQFYLVALPWLVLSETGSATAMSTVLTVGAVTQVMLMIIGGTITDRLSPRRILMITAFARAILVASIGTLSAMHLLRIWHLYCFSVLFGIADAFSLPAGEALLPLLVAEEELRAANSLVMSTAQITEVVAPSPAGMFIRKVGLPWAFFVDALSFIFVIAALWVLPEHLFPIKQNVNRTSIRQSIVEGLRYVWADTSLRSLMLIGTVLNFCTAGLLRVGLAYLVKVNFDSPASYGLLMSASAVGGLAGSVLAGFWSVRRLGLMIVVVIATTGSLLSTIGQWTSLWEVGLALIIMGAAVGFMNIHFISWVQMRVDTALRGRVMSVLMLSAMGLLPLSLVFGGLLVQWNIQQGFFVAGLFLMFLALSVGLKSTVRQILS